MLAKFLCFGKTIDLTSDLIDIKSNNFKVDESGNLTCTNADVSGTIKSNNATITGGKILLQNCGGVGDEFQLNGNSGHFWAGSAGFEVTDSSDSYSIFANVTETNDALIQLRKNSTYTQVCATGIKTPKLTQTSLEKDKKNFEKLQNALKILKETDIYKYNLNFEGDNVKKHIGIVIGKKYKYSKEITATDEDGVDLYAMISVLWRAVQEQQEIIESMQNRENSMEEK